MRNVFLGPTRYWVGLLALAALLYTLGAYALHVRHFLWFLLLLFAAACTLVLYVVRHYRPGLKVTREPLPKSGEGL